MSRFAFGLLLVLAFGGAVAVFCILTINGKDTGAYVTFVSGLMLVPSSLSAYTAFKTSTKVDRVQNEVESVKEHVTNGNGHA